MIITKVTIGFVTQVYDTELNRFVSQEFTGSDERTWESGIDTPCEPPTNSDGEEPYLNYDMVQPAYHCHDFKTNDKVVATPDPQDTWHEFEGVVIGFKKKYNLFQVRDQDDDVFDCYPYQLKHA